MFQSYQPVPLTFLCFHVCILRHTYSSSAPCKMSYCRSIRLKTIPFSFWSPFPFPFIRSIDTHNTLITKTHAHTYTHIHTQLLNGHFLCVHEEGTLSSSLQLFPDSVVSTNGTWLKTYTHVHTRTEAKKHTHTQDIPLHSPLH